MKPSRGSPGFEERFGDGAAEATVHPVLLDAEDPTRFFRGTHQRVNTSCVAWKRRSVSESDSRRVNVTGDSRNVGFPHPEWFVVIDSTSSFRE